MIDLMKFFSISRSDVDNDIAHGATDVGRVRDNNEDYFMINAEKNLFLISDGIGGHKAGEIASFYASKNVNEFLSEELISKIRDNPAKIKAAIMDSIQLAHTNLREIAEKNVKCSDMGCTILVALIVKNTLHIGHVGDTRAYISRDDDLNLLTTDHSYAMELVKSGKMKIEDLKSSSLKNQLIQALGPPIDISPDYNSYNIKGNEKILLCTDGLWDTVNDRDIHDILKQNKSKREIARELIKKANKNGGHDNITVVLIEYNEQTASRKKTGDKMDKTGEYKMIFSYPEKNDKT